MARIDADTDVLSCITYQGDLTGVHFSDATFADLVITHEI